MEWLVWPALVLLGLAVGAYGTLIGAGGGFLLVPVLLIIYPDDPPQLITSISLAVVFCNAASGSVAYLRQHRVDFLAGNAFAAGTIPGAVAGALAVGLLSRTVFDTVFALLLLAVAAFLTLRPGPRVVQRRSRRGEVTRLITDAHGDTFFYSYNLWLGMLLSVLVGIVSSLFGIGGGVLHVPLMIQVLHFPAHIATATSTYVLTVTALTGTIVHIANGELEGGLDQVVPLAIGVIIGAQVGALLSARIRGPVIVRLLAGAMVLIALRLLAGTVVG